MRRRAVLIGFGAVVVLAVAAAALWFLVIREDAPEEVSLGCAAEGTAPAGTLDGTWRVREGTAAGETLLQDEAPPPFAGYRIDEDLRAVRTTAVGRTSEVTGEVTADGDSVNAARFEVDMTSLESSESRRDSAMKDRGLEAEAFPTAVFELTEPIALDQAIGCQEVTAAGQITLHGQTRPVTIPLTVIRWATPSSSGAVRRSPWPTSASTSSASVRPRSTPPGNSS